MAVHNTEAESPVETRVGSHLALADSSEAVREDNPASPAELMAADFLPPPNWPTLQATLTELCLCLTEAVPSVESAGVVIFPPESLQPGERPTLDRAEVIGAAPVGAAVLRIESDLDEGPVVTACGSQSIVTSGDLSTDERWPRFGPAVADLQLHSAVAVPLRGISSVTAGVLSTYSHQRNAFDVRAIHLITVVADVVRTAMLGAEMLERSRRSLEAMREAWDRARVVNQAVGVLARWNCTEEQALSRLSRMANRAHEDLAVSARMIVEEARQEAHLRFISSPNSSRKG